MQIYPGPRFETHLINEHGIIFDLDYIISLSVFKEENQELPRIDSGKRVNGDSSGHFKTGKKSGFPFKVKKIEPQTHVKWKKALDL